MRNKRRKNGRPVVLRRHSSPPRPRNSRRNPQPVLDSRQVLKARIDISRMFAADAPLPAIEKLVDLQPAKDNPAVILRAKTESIRPEFARLAEEWRMDTQHLSQISKKVLHPAYFRIMGMGEPVTPLLLEALRDRPAHWFAALRAITNIDPVSPGSNPSAARDAWLDWGRKHGLID